MLVFFFRLWSGCIWLGSVNRNWFDNCGRLSRFSGTYEAGGRGDDTLAPSMLWYSCRAGTRDTESANSKTRYRNTSCHEYKNSEAQYRNTSCHEYKNSEAQYRNTSCNEYKNSEAQCRNTSCNEYKNSEAQCRNTSYTETANSRA